MAAAELLWQPLLLNRALEAESVYRLILLSTRHCTKPQGGSTHEGGKSGAERGEGRGGQGGGAEEVDIGQLRSSLGILDIEERSCVSFNLAFLLASRGLETGNREACIEATDMLAEIQTLGRARRSAPQTHAGVIFLQARLCLWRRQVYEAEALFHTVLAKNPHHIDARLRLAQALYESLWEESRPEGLQVDTVHLLFRWKHRLEASCFDTWASATKELRKLRNTRKSLGIHLPRAQGLVSRWQEALILVEQVLEEDPANGGARLLLASICANHLQDAPRAHQVPLN